MSNLLKRYDGEIGGFVGFDAASGGRDGLAEVGGAFAGDGEESDRAVRRFDADAA